jgi:hypothetical protein
MSKGSIKKQDFCVLSNLIFEIAMILKMLTKNCPTTRHGGACGERSLLLILDLGTRWG